METNRRTTDPTATTTTASVALAPIIRGCDRRLYRLAGSLTRNIWFGMDGDPGSETARSRSLPSDSDQRRP